jgi:hypothetical protein
MGYSMAVDGSHQGRARGGLARAALTLVLIGALVGPQAGCSFLFVQTPEPKEARRGQVVDCTSSNAAPVIDMLVMGWQIVRTLIALGATDEQYRGAPITREADITLGISLTALFGGSMAAGFSWTKECREALAQDSYPGPRPRPRPGASSKPTLRMGPAPSRKQEEQEEEAAVQARSAERARAAAAESAAAAEAARAAPPAAPPANAPAAPQRDDTE